jgi:ADP-heptose:LPS heptosyltransferase
MENVAALIEMCNVVISPSCATVHLAGAMGKDVLLLDANKLWYWNNRVGNESLWYSGVKIFQRENMNAPWDLQLQQVKDELESSPFCVTTPTQTSSCVPTPIRRM